MIGSGIGVMFLAWGLLLALLVGAAILVFRLVTGQYVPVHNAQPTARQVLDERLARGEITREDYDLVLARIER